MPLFDFKCPACGRVVEMNVKTAQDTVYCFNCESVMERQMAAPYGKVVGYSYLNGYSKKVGDNNTPD